jgi:hypothetical protein
MRWCAEIVLVIGGKKVLQGDSEPADRAEVGEEGGEDSIHSSAHPKSPRSGEGSESCFSLSSLKETLSNGATATTDVRKVCNHSGRGVHSICSFAIMIM